MAVKYDTLKNRKKKKEKRRKDKEKEKLKKRTEKKSEGRCKICGKGKRRRRCGAQIVATSLKSLGAQLQSNTHRQRDGKQDLLCDNSRECQSKCGHQCSNFDKVHFPQESRRFFW